MELTEKKCKPCEDGEEPFSNKSAEDMLGEVDGWGLVDEAKKISKEMKFNNFKEALDFVNKVGELAEEEGHHPDIFLTYGLVRIDLSTHSIGGLSENDFILAAKIDSLK